MKLFLPAAIVSIGGLLVAYEHDEALSAGGAQASEVEASQNQDVDLERELARVQREIERALAEAERAQVRAVEHADREKADAAREAERAVREAQRTAERALANAERVHQAAMRQAEREREAAMERAEHAMRSAEIEREQALVRAAQAREGVLRVAEGQRHARAHGEMGGFPAPAPRARREVEAVRAELERVARAPRAAGSQDEALRQLEARVSELERRLGVEGGGAPQAARAPRAPHAPHAPHAPSFSGGVRSGSVLVVPGAPSAPRAFALARVRGACPACGEGDCSDCSDHDDCDECEVEAGCCAAPDVAELEDGFAALAQLGEMEFDFDFDFEELAQLEDLEIELEGLEDLAELEDLEPLEMDEARACEDAEEACGAEEPCEAPAAPEAEESEFDLDFDVFGEDWEATPAAPAATSLEPTVVSFPAPGTPILQTVGFSARPVIHELTDIVSGMRDEVASLRETLRSLRAEVRSAERADFESQL